MDLKIPGYELIRTIGKGGMATVYLAKQNVLDRNVALKVMSRNLAEDPEFGKRFMSEARIVSQLVHPNIVTVYEVGQFEDRYFLSMEYVDGYDLRAKKSKLDLAGKIRVIEDIARALHYAGDKGYVHRDIKPENIMFRAGDGSAVLTDFGIAKAVESDLSMTQTGTAVGTPHYMSPEQAKGKLVDPRSDLYSLGIVFYQLLTGRVPYDGESAIAIGIKHITEPLPVLPSQLKVLQPVLDGLLEKNKQHRYANGLELLNDLRKIDFRDLEAAAGHDAQAIADAENAETQVAGVSDEFDETDRFTLTNMPVTEEQVAQPGSRGAVFFSVIFVLLAIAFFIYMARPSLLEPYIARGEQAVKPFIERGSQLSRDIGKQLPSLQSDLSGDEERPVSAAPEQDNTTQTALEPDSVEQNLEPESETTHSGKIEGRDSVPIQTELGNSSDEPLPSGVVSQETFEAPDLPSIESLRAGINNLKEKVALDPLLMEEYVQRHRELLNHYPDDTETLASLGLIKLKMEKAVTEAISQSRFDSARSRIRTLTQLFPNIDPARVSEFNNDIAQRERISVFLKQAEENMSSGRISSPEGNNAIDSYLSVLSIDAEHTVAIDSLNKISNAYIGKAENSIASENLEQALEYVNIALKAFSDNPSAVELKRSLLAKQAQLQQIADALSAAQKYSDLGYLYSPEGGSAFDEYQKVLQLDAAHTEGLRGLEGLVDLLSVKVWALVGEAKFDAARSELARPMILMPDNARLQAMLTAIDEVDPIDSEDTTLR
jgi:serine/threonine protein kinase